MFIIVVTIFALCWLPYHGYFIYAYHNNAFASTVYVQHMYLAFYWLAMSNTMVNPIIYYWMNHRFRVYFQQIICHCCCFRRKKKDNLELTNTKHNSQSELARSRSARNNMTVRQRSGSYRWHRRTEESQVCHIPVNRRTNGVTHAQNGNIEVLEAPQCLA